MNRVTIILAVGGLVCAGALHSQPGPVSASKLEVPPSLLRPITLSDIRAEVAPLEESKTLHDPLGIPRLRTTPLPKGVREIRIYTGLVVGYPHSGLIVREENGNVTGRLFRYWPLNDTSFTEIDMESSYARNEAGRCTKPVRGKEAIVCTVLFTQEPNWRAVLASLDSVNAWSLPDESRVPRYKEVIDGWVLRVEARRDTAYTRYQYHNPQVYRPPEGTNALHILNMVPSLFRHSRPPENLKYIHGILVYGRDSSDFTPCGQPGQTGFLEGMLYPIAKVIGDSVYRAHTGPTRVLEIEAWARLSDEPTVRYKRTFNRAWGVDSMTVVRPASTRSCRTD